MNNNQSKVAFVTGGGTGIGKSIAITFAKNGYDVAISYRGSIEGALKVKEEIEKLGQKCFMLKADLSKYSDIVNMFNEFKKVSDRLDVLVNNAGLTVTMPFLETTELVSPLYSTLLKSLFIPVSITFALEYFKFTVTPDVYQPSFCWPTTSSSQVKFSILHSGTTSIG